MKDHEADSPNRGPAETVLRHLRQYPKAVVTVQTDNPDAARVDIEAVGATSAELARVKYAPIAKLATPRGPTQLLHRIPKHLLPPDPHVTPRSREADPEHVTAAEAKRARKAAARLASMGGGR